MPDHTPSTETVRLARLAADGDEGAFDQIFTLYYPRIRAFAARMVSEVTEAEDVAQEVFIRAARSIGSLHNLDRFDSWLFRIAGNLCRDRLRSKMREDRACTAFSEPDGGSGKSEFDQIGEAISRLPPDQRAAILFVYFEGLNHRKAAIALGCAEPTVSWRLMLARQMLKKLLKP